MRFSIPRVQATIDVDRFLDEFYLPRRPVIVEGAASDWPALTIWTREYLEERLAREPASSTRNPYWWDVDTGLVSADVREPALVSESRMRRAPRERRRSTRLWMSNRGSHTPWHYDGNSVEIFNVQVTGRKRFTLVSPETPIPLAAFSVFGAAPDIAPWALLTRHHEYSELELRPGDLLYLPRHWLHFVESLGAFNTNLNWVWTDLASGSLETRVGTRERDVVAGLYPLFAAERQLARVSSRFGLPRLRVKHYTPEYMAEYGGAGDFAVAREFMRQRGWRRACATLFLELSKAVLEGVWSTR